MKFPELFYYGTLKGAVRLDRSKEMSVRVSPCWRQLYGSCDAEKTRVFLRLASEIRDRFLVQRSNIFVVN